MRNKKITIYLCDVMATAAFSVGLPVSFGAEELNSTRYTFNGINNSQISNLNFKEE